MYAISNKKIIRRILHNMNKLENYRSCGQIAVNPTAKLIYLALCDAVNYGNYVIIPQRRIAEALGISRKAVSAICGGWNGPERL